MIKLTDKKIIGLIGMSGAGKTTISSCFEKNSYAVIDCDICAREVTVAGGPALVEIANELSPTLIRKDGTLDRRATAELIFNNEEMRLIYNRIIYPYITYNVMCKIKAADNDVLLDAPTLFDAQLEGICDNIVSVCADKKLCIERIMQRDGISEALAAARLGSQHQIEWYRSHSDYCFINNGTKSKLVRHAENIISELKGR